MTSHEIATALGRATETEKAEFAHFLMAALSPLGLEDADATVRQIVAACDRFAAEAEAGEELS